MWLAPVEEELSAGTHQPEELEELTEKMRPHSSARIFIHLLVCCKQENEVILVLKEVLIKGRLTMDFGIRCCYLPPSSSRTFLGGFL